VLTIYRCQEEADDDRDVYWHNLDVQHVPYQPRQSLNELESKREVRLLLILAVQMLPTLARLHLEAEYPILKKFDQSVLVISHIQELQ
jgi:hypothetical protein